MFLPKIVIKKPSKKALAQSKSQTAQIITLSSRAEILNELISEKEKERTVNKSDTNIFMASNNVCKMTFFCFRQIIALKIVYQIEIEDILFAPFQGHKSDAILEQHLNADLEKGRLCLNHRLDCSCSCIEFRTAKITFNTPVCKSLLMLELN